MRSNLQDSIVLITSSDPNTGGSDFGTGFVVHHDKQASYVITCAHVVHAVGRAKNILAGHVAATVVALEEGIDVAVLHVGDLQKQPSLSLQASGEKGTSFLTAGFQLYSGKQYRMRQLQGILGEQGVVETRNQTHRTKSWDLEITDGYQLAPGYSGSPVVANGSGYVVGIVTDREGDGQKGAAISVEAVEYVWHNMPASVVVPAQTAKAPFPVQRQPFTSAARQQLVDLLWQCDSMSDPDVRDMVVTDLPKDFRGLMKRNKQLLKLDIRHIIDACLNHSDGLTILIETMKKYEAPSSIPLQKVEAFLQGMQF